tara:strand:+ start:1742 stop:1921 length:180 start_codon:yes stop_codon:yes gene_type:complete
MDQIEITSAQYYADEGRNLCIIATIGGVKKVVPLSYSNRHYAEIMRQVEAGELTIEEAS